MLNGSSTEPSNSILKCPKDRARNEENMRSHRTSSVRRAAGFMVLAWTIMLHGNKGNIWKRGVWPKMLDDNC